ncbi:acid-soluble spore protein H [Anoxybacillus gonensis]|uniref:Small acid-soluble spore protein n=2 Tax=Anoxybacillus TaxID=150247 RepID=R4G110_9BACL|nr:MULTISPECIES: small acid-soluble spore protein H [Anoxybacillus]AXM87759.1 H-type small acid-soluble spore protein [Anoxybacillus ayderensis G10]THD16232.1 H-type small acid-soluble spore protein [Anoxybacillus ayderensis]AKS38173.1 acid-soluble spore protein H [Anoxybacillus gonensis]KGP60771.1 acid-soluble spore protein H [Anoxybacillus gonensis]MBW9218491.1 small acid-soluble spore protein H [Anoxybacillus sp. ST70]
MNITRAQQIAQSPDMKNVTYNGKAVYIEHVDVQTEMATIHFLNNPEKQQRVPISQLEEH